MWDVQEPTHYSQRVRHVPGLSSKRWPAWFESYSLQFPWVISVTMRWNYPPRFSWNTASRSLILIYFHYYYYYYYVTLKLWQMLCRHYTKGASHSQWPKVFYVISSSSAFQILLLLLLFLLLLLLPIITTAQYTVLTYLQGIWFQDRGKSNKQKYKRVVNVLDP